MNTTIHKITVPFKNSIGTVSGRIGALLWSAGCVKSQHMLGALLGGILILGVSPTFAVGPELSDQEVRQAWDQSQREAQPVPELSTLDRTQGPQLLTDEELDHVTAGGFGRSDFGLGSDKLNSLTGIATIKALRSGSRFLRGYDLEKNDKL